jgi:uncharacterized membrane protein YkvA (DUF1232 family)
MPVMLQSIKSWVARVKQDAVMLWFARSHPRTPLLPKLLSIATAAYVLSPIDLIPDFIPVIGYLDEWIIVPIMIWVVARLLPDDVIAESRAKAQMWMAQRQQKPTSYAGALIVVVLWVGGAYLSWIWFVA